MLLSYDVLVVLNGLFYINTLMFQCAAFLRLRYTRPDLVRPYQVPGGTIGAWLFVILLLPITILFAVTTYQESLWAIAIVYGFNGVLLLLSFVWVKYGYQKEHFELNVIEEYSSLH
jgi:amino acid transporter